MRDKPFKDKHNGSYKLTLMPLTITNKADDYINQIPEVYVSV